MFPIFLSRFTHHAALGSAAPALNEGKGGGASWFAATLDSSKLLLYSLKRFPIYFPHRR